MIADDLDPWQKALLVHGLLDLYENDGEPAYVNDIRKSMEKIWTDSQSGRTLALSHDRATQTSLADIYARLGAL
jgi:hypothetical protein